MKFDHSEPDFSIVIFWVLDLKKKVWVKYAFQIQPESSGGDFGIHQAVQGATIDVDGRGTGEGRIVRKDQVPFWSNDFASWLCKLVNDDKELGQLLQKFGGTR